MPGRRVHLTACVSNSVLGCFHKIAGGLFVRDWSRDCIARRSFQFQASLILLTSGCRKDLIVMPTSYSNILNSFNDRHRLLSSSENSNQCYRHTPSSPVAFVSGGCTKTALCSFIEPFIPIFFFWFWISNVVHLAFLELEYLHLCGCCYCSHHSYDS